jgi:hypothetical protein
MIEADDLYRIVGLAFIILIVVAVGTKMLKYQAKIVEGMTSSSTDKDKIASAVSSNSDKISDTLLPSKYRSSYEDTIINLEKAVGLALVSEVVNNAETISADPTTDAAQKAMTNINTMETFRASLNQAMVILDKSQ